MTTEQPKSPLDEILDAQNGTGEDSWYPTYANALKEIRHGEKRSCWMWYIWPSMKGVRQHRKPSMLLENFEQVKEYLGHATLRSRLLEITEAAVRQLRQGVHPSTLFGGDLDSSKVYEACTVFAAAAVAMDDKDAARLFAKGHAFYGKMNSAAIDALNKDQTFNEPSECLKRVDLLVRHYAQ